MIKKNFFNEILFKERINKKLKLFKSLLPSFNIGLNIFENFLQIYDKKLFLLIIKTLFSKQDINFRINEETVILDLPFFNFKRFYIRLWKGYKNLIKQSYKKLKSDSELLNIIYEESNSFYLICKTSNFSTDSRDFQIFVKKEKYFKKLVKRYLILSKKYKIRIKKKRKKIKYINKLLINLLREYLIFIEENRGYSNEVLKDDLEYFYERYDFIFSKITRILKLEILRLLDKN